MSARRKHVVVIYYSMYGHILTLAREVVKGLEKAGGTFNITEYFNQTKLKPWTI